MIWLRRFQNRIIGEHTYVSAALVDQALVSGTSFLTAIILARFLGAEEFGRYVLAWFAVYLAQNVQGVLISAPLMTLSVQWNDRDRRAAFGTVFTHQALLAFATFILVFCALKFSALLVPEWKLDTLALPTACLAAFIQGPDLFRVYNFVLDRGWRSVTVDALRCALQFFSLLGVFLYWPANTSVSTAIWLMAAANLIPLVLCLIWVEAASFNSAIFLSTTRRHWKFARWLLASTLAQWSREGLASIAVGQFLGLGEVGILRASQQLVFAINVPLQALGNVIPVHASRAYSSGGLVDLKKFLRTFALKFMIPMAALLVVIGLFGETLLTTVYGPSYAGYGYMVALYAVIMGIYLGKDAMIMAMRAMQRTDFEFRANMIAALIGGLAAYPLVATFGMVGALLAEGLFIIAVLCIGGLLLRKSIDTPQQP
ncbi:MAG: lipopolysaccharide biosynthesis protein [Hyphomicrobiaceae bacterium]